MKTLAALAEDLAAGRTTSRALTEDCLARIADPQGEGARAFVQVTPDAARATADRMDALRAAGRAPSRFAGIPISIKDLFDVEAQVTRAGSLALADAPPASKDAACIARLRSAGFVFVGRTNMTEFAFSGLGLNPHYGTPRNAWRRPKTGSEGAIPGGSSSGAAVSVTDGMAHAAIGTDTGGSCRIPAAFNRLVGFKPTASRVLRDGVFPLSQTLDSVGPIARSVACCAALDAIMSGEPAPELGALALGGLRFAAPTTFVRDGMDADVAGAFARALSEVSRAGARIEEIEVPEFSEIRAINAKGGFAAYEAYARHRDLIEAEAALYDPRVLVRIRRGAEQSAADYEALKEARADWIARVSKRLGAYDAILAPAVPIAPPLVSELADDADYGRINALVLRNPAVINLLDGCAISMPMSAADEPPAGLMIAALRGQDHRLLQIADTIERCLA